MTSLTRDGTAKPISRDQILRREKGQGNLFFFIFPVHVQLITKNRIGNLINGIIRVMHTRYSAIYNTYSLYNVVVPFYPVSVFLDFWRTVFYYPENYRH